MMRSRSLICSFLFVVPTSASAAEPKAKPEPTPVAVVWKDVESAFGCFFFCGPGDLGRDTKLGERGTVVEAESWLTLELEGGVRFRGRVTGRKVRLERQSAHEYSGTWQVLETIEGTWADGVLSGDYAYEECDTTRREGCPGRCTIRARVEAIPAERQLKETDRAIAAAVRYCIESGLQFNPAFRRAGRVTVRWRGDDRGTLVEVGFWENDFADLWVNSVDPFNTCVEKQLRAAKVSWRGTGSFTVKVASPP